MGAGSSAVRRRWRSRFKLPAPLPARSGGAGSQPDRQGASGACCPCLAGRAPRECRAPPRMVPGAAVATVTRERVTAAELPTFRGSAALGQGRLRTTACSSSWLRYSSCSARVAMDALEPRRAGNASATLLLLWRRASGAHGPLAALLRKSATKAFHWPASGGCAS
jgi:hypothetical protein